MIQPVIKWTGSKRSQAEKIKSLMPGEYGVYYEPFIGGGSILYAANPEKAICGDICDPLIKLWLEIRDNPVALAASYRSSWERLQRGGEVVYYEVRSAFNRTHSPEDFLFLSRTCANGLIRFNAKGEFNSSFHFSRPGIHPDRLEKIIFDWSKRISGVVFLSGDYKDTTLDARPGDFMYLDPPYFNTRGQYYGTIDFDEFMGFLDALNVKGIKFALSYDGKRGDKDCTVDIPKELYKNHHFIYSGCSSFNRLMDKKIVPVFESLYTNY